jgi:hypothetical protein
MFLTFGTTMDSNRTKGANSAWEMNITGYEREDFGERHWRCVTTTLPVEYTLKLEFLGVCFY